MAQTSPGTAQRRTSGAGRGVSGSKTYSDWLKEIVAIDFHALGGKRRGKLKPGHVWEPESIAKMRKARIRWWKEKRKRDAAAKPKVQKGALLRPWTYRDGKGLSQDFRMIAVMEPGQWYAMPDIATLSGVAYDNSHGVTFRLLAKGRIERVQDPAWRPPVKARGIPRHIYLKGRPPRFLYRLTAKGEALRPLAIMLH